MAGRSDQALVRSGAAVSRKQQILDSPGHQILKKFRLGAPSERRAVVRLGLGAVQVSLLVLSRSLVSCQDGPMTLCGTQEWAVGCDDS